MGVGLRGGEDDLTAHLVLGVGGLLETGEAQLLEYSARVVRGGDSGHHLQQARTYMLYDI